MQLNPSWLTQQGEDTGLFTHLHTCLREVKSPVGVAVSGGGDSMALLRLVAEWAGCLGVSIIPVTVDHGLRDGSAAEAAQVATVCAKMGLPHDTLKWADWDGHGNIQAAARNARYRLMADWAAEKGISDIVLGHTQDDVAETFVMRLARKAGIDGLATMDRAFQRDGVLWHRPLLAVTRADLRDYLRRHDVPWVDDPSNADLDFERVRVRQALAHLAELTVTPGVLTHTAQAARQARDALDYYTRAEAQTRIRQQDGDLILSDLAGLPVDMQRRLWSKAVQWMGRLDYPPRATTVQHLREGLALDGVATGGGCIVTLTGADARIAREANAVRDRLTLTDDGGFWTWDGYWRIGGGSTFVPGLRIARLGKGIRNCPDWRDAGLPRSSLLATPAVWMGDTLIAAPAAGLQNDWTAQIVADFHDWLNVH